MVSNAVSSALSLLVLIGVGFYITGKSWFKEHGADLFSKYAVRIAIPCYMTYNVVTTCKTRDGLWELIKSIPIPIFTILLSLTLGLLLSKICRIQVGRRGVFVNAVTFSNIVLIGFPIITSLFGDNATVYGMIYYMANTVLFWTVGVYLLRQDGNQRDARIFSAANLKKIFSPPMVGFLLGVFLVVVGIPIPKFLFMPLDMLRQSTTPITMIFIGSIIRQTDFKKMHIKKDLFLVLAVRFIISPFFMAMVCTLLPIDPMMKKVFFILATMPAMSQLGIMTKESESDYEFASLMVAVTTMVCMVFLPIYTAVIHILNF